MDKIIAEYGCDQQGRWWWRSSDATHGPFATEKEARKHSEVTLFGPDCKIYEGGMWDPNWDKKQ
jgi:hypothetical protein